MILSLHGLLAVVMAVGSLHTITASEAPSLPWTIDVQIEIQPQASGQIHTDGRVHWASVPHYDSRADLFIMQKEDYHDEDAGVRYVWVTRDVVSPALEREEQRHEASGQEARDTLHDLLHGEYIEGTTSSENASSGITTVKSYDYDGGTSSLLRVPISLLPTLDVHLGRFARGYLLPRVPSSPSSLSASPNDTYTFPIPELNPFISALTHSPHWDTSALTKTALTLTGEDQSALNEDERWTTRHSATDGCLRASEWILAQAREALRGVKGAQCELEAYLPGSFAPNVVCVVQRQEPTGQEGEQSLLQWETSSSPSSSSYNADEAVLLSAHYDSRGSFGEPAAPGGDDDGSGTTMLLAITRVLGDALRGDSHPSAPASHRRREIQLVWFSGEEQGLVGSQHYAQALRSSSFDPNPPRSSHLRLALQTDMIAYHSSGEPLQIAFPDKLSTPSATKYFWDVAGLYSPELVRGYTPACCSDHQSFWEAGFPATWVFERNGPIADPKYHNSKDLVNREGYDFEQLRAIGRVVLAGAAGLIWE